MTDLFNWRSLESRRLVVILVILIVACSSFNASQYGRFPTGEGYDIVPRPLLNYTSMGFENFSTVMDCWKESYEVPLNTTNHYWTTAGAYYLHRTDPQTPNPSPAGKGMDVFPPPYGQMEAAYYLKRGTYAYFYSDLLTQGSIESGNWTLYIWAWTATRSSKLDVYIDLVYQDGTNVRAIGSTLAVSITTTTAALYVINITGGSMTVNTNDRVRLTLYNKATSTDPHIHFYYDGYGTQTEGNETRLNPLMSEKPIVTRSQKYVQEGDWSLVQNVSHTHGWAKYLFGALSSKNSYYVAIPKNFNVSLYWLVPSLTTNDTIQFSIGIDNAPYTPGFDFELIYYWGNPNNVKNYFSGTYQAIQISSSISTGSWNHYQLNWTKDASNYWSLTYPRVEGVAIGSRNSVNSTLSSYWDNLTFIGYWYGVKKVIKLQLINEILTRKFNVTDTWSIQNDQALDPQRANATAANQWYYKWWDERKICVINVSDTYEILGNSTSQGIFSYYDNDWNPEDDTVINDWSGYVKYNVTDFKLTAYGKNLEYLDYVLVEYVIVFSGPSGTFKFDNESTATAANDPDEYGGVEYWILEKQGNEYRNFITSNSTFLASY